MLNRRIETAGPAMYALLRKLGEDTLIRRGSGPLAQETRELLARIKRYQNHGADCDDSLNCNCPDIEENHGTGCDGPYNCTCGRIP
jgi:hypothetical protein